MEAGPCRDSRQPLVPGGAFAHGPGGGPARWHCLLPSSCTDCVPMPLPQSPSARPFPGHPSAPVNFGDQLASDGSSLWRTWDFSKQIWGRNTKSEKEGRYYLLSWCHFGSRDSVWKSDTLNKRSRCGLVCVEAPSLPESFEMLSREEKQRLSGDLHVCPWILRQSVYTFVFNKGWRKLKSDLD